MANHIRVWRPAGLIALFALAAVSLAIAGCGGDDEEVSQPTVVATRVVTSTPSPAATTAPAAAATATATSAATKAPEHDEEGTLTLQAATAAITLDGRMDDWASVPGLEVPLEAIPEEFRDDPTAGKNVTVTLKVANDDKNIYVLVAVPDGYDFDPDNRHRSPAIAVEWLIDEGASPHMGAAEPDFKDDTGMVDIWHWEMDCGPGELSGGVFATGNDPACNLDDEYATLTDEREDDDSENSLTGSWDHTARAQGIGAAGTFVFEFARPLQTGDAQDAQFTPGGTAQVALAYWDGNEGRAKDGGWTDAGHVQSAEDGWIDVTLSQ